MCESDLAQADARIVAWEADDQALMDIFNDPNRDLHTENAIAMNLQDRLSRTARYWAKTGVHATNYLTTPRTLGQELGIPKSEAAKFINKWFELHPGIKEWHHRVETELQHARTTTNKWGHVRRWFGRIDQCLTDAVAWIPQSTVAITINKALVAMHNKFYPDVIPLIQVHDSLVYQIDLRYYPKILPEIKKCLTITIPYERELIIPVDLKCSTKSWGDCKKRNWFAV